MDAQQVMAMEQAYLMHTFRRLPVVLSHGEGVRVYDTDGKAYLDFLAGIAVNVLGHNHPLLVRAIAAQAEKLIHCSNLVYTEVQVALARKLAAITMGGKVFFANSGAEANEGAIKLARKYASLNTPGRYEIITAQDSFHGRTLATLTATAQVKYQQGFGPLPPGFRYVPFNDLAALEAALTPATCAVMLEPVQGESGVRPADPLYLGGVRELCDRHGLILILDEIQTGLGRTGKMFAFEHYEIKPDILTLAKGLGGGVPIGAVIATERVAAAFQPGDHGSTFGGNPLACAAALATLGAIETENLVARAAQTGAYFKQKLEQLQARHTSITAVRGLGLMLGIELAFPGKAVVDKSLARGAIINCAHGNVLRLVPPLIVTEEDVDGLVAILDTVLAETAG